jgi:rod shape determining protein RodA
MINRHLSRDGEHFDFRRISQLNGVVLVLTLVLGVFGIAMMYSAAGGAWQPYATRQLVRFLLGIFLMISVALIPIRFWQRSAYILYGLGVIALLIVEVMGHIGMGAQRWVQFAGLTVQPSEFMKLALILALARYFHGVHPSDQHKIVWMIPPLLLIAIPAALILKQPNLGTATITCGVGAFIWFAAGLRWRWILGAGGLLAASLPIAWQFLHDYQKRRVLTFLDPEKDPLGAGYNILQSIIAIGSGGLSGKGFTKGSQGQLDFLPEKHTDFIFTMVAEEFGFLGSLFLLALFTLLFAYGIGIAIRSRHRFGGLIAIGITAMLWLHMMINMAMVMGLIPVVGIPLPFLSYGGTMLLSTMIGIGLLQNVYVYRDAMLSKGVGRL